MLANYEEACTWLFGQFPAYHNLGAAAYNPGLKNTEEILDFFDNPHLSLRFFHVGGTNGKGSVSAMLTSIAMESGEKVGTFTSPHIMDFSERIRINGKTISEAFVLDFCNRVKSNTWEIQPSFFEITWAMALVYFKQNNCSLVVAEVGLGGRLDATNIITPEISIITNISLDHINILGSTRAEIAGEKAGIIKPGVPVLLGEFDNETGPVFEHKAKETNSEIHIANQNIDFPKEIIGYQHLNFAIVRKAVDVLNHRKWSISKEHLLSGIRNLGKNTGFYGRLQLLGNNPTLLLDCAHNEAGIKALFASLPESKGELHIVYGTSSDKDLKSIIPVLPHHASYFFCEFDNPRSMKKEALQSEFNDFSAKNKTFFSSVQSAFERVQSIANKADTIVVCGSFFLAHDFFSFFSPDMLDIKE